MADFGGDNDDEPSGYKRPPKWGQFQRGQSGNPKGRPKGTGKKTMSAKDIAKHLTESEEILAKLVEEQVELARAGKKVLFSKKEALRHVQYNLAIKGNGLVMRDLNRDIVRLEAKKEAIERAKTEAAEQAAEEKVKRDEAWFQHLVELKDRQAKAWERAAAEGKTEPDTPWPHPDDILINSENRTAWVRGPSGAEEAIKWEHCRRVRDHFLDRYALALCEERKGEALVSTIWWAALLQEDLHLPRRWQVTHNLDWEVARRMLLSLPGLRKRVAAGAAEFEVKSPGERQSKESYQRQNKLWDPLIKALGYKSLKHMNSALEQHSLDERRTASG
jgi:hypothetical protein